jgi:hypothetical protein
VSIKQLIHHVVDRAYESGSDISPMQIARIVEQEFPAEYADYMVSAARKGVQGIATEVLKAAAKTKQQAFPGMELPQWLTVLDGEGGYAYRPLRTSTLKDHATDVQVRRTNAERVMQELAEAERRNEQLWSVDGAHDDMLISDALAALQQAQP